MTVQFITAKDSTRVVYDVEGQGPALMLLHGAGKTRKDWRKAGYIERLLMDFQVISVDIRGSGDSDIRTEIEDFNLDKICDDLIMVADACEVEKFGVWGYSFGGNIGRYLAARSERVSALAVIGVPYGPAVNNEFDQYIDEFIGKYGPLAQEYRAGKLNAAKRDSALKGRIPVWVACFQAMRGWPSVEIAETRCPTILLSGTRNKSAFEWIKINREELDATRIRVEIIEGLNHQQEFSQIEQVFPAVSSFLKDHL